MTLIMPLLKEKSHPYKTHDFPRRAVPTFLGSLVGAIRILRKTI